jgi:hypothetical protein
METCKPTSTPLDVNTMLIKRVELTKGKFREMVKIPYRQVIGNIMYVMITTTRLYIAIVVSIISQFMQDLGLPHWKIVKRILRYLHGTKDYFFQYSRVGNGTIIIGLCDSNWGSIGHPTFNYLVCFSFGPCNNHLVKQATTHGGVFYHYG